MSSLSVNDLKSISKLFYINMFAFRKPAEDINEIFKRQAMVSLHSSASTNQIEWRDPYDTVHDDDEEDLSKLIHQANK